jgi:hypothetical protein
MNSRWKMRDAREADYEMWGNAFGDLLHVAVKKIVEGVPLEQALEQAWKEKGPQGMIQSPRLVALARNKMKLLLERFDEKEKAFRESGQTRLFSLEGPSFEWKRKGLVIRGTPDRIEEHSEGLFLIDYKTQAQSVGASVMLETGNSMQLGIYALALREKLKREVIGAQFVELTRDASRSRGILFKKYNGKKVPSPLHQSRATASLLEGEPSEAWPRFEQWIDRWVEGYQKGFFQARPTREEECAGCFHSDTCGLRRRRGRDESAEGAAARRDRNAVAAARRDESTGASK